MACIDAAAVTCPRVVLRAVVGRGVSAAGSASTSVVLGRSMTLALGAALQSDLSEHDSTVSVAGSAVLNSETSVCLPNFLFSRRALCYAAQRRTYATL